MIRVIKELLLLQWRGFVRQPGVLFWALAFPIILSGLLGMAFSKKGDQALPVIFIASEAEEMERTIAVTAKLQPNPLLAVSVESEDKARLSLRRGRAVLAVFRPWDPKERRFLLDPTNSESELALRRVKGWLAGEAKPKDLVILDAKGSRYIDFVLPGLFVSSVINSCLWGVGWLLIDYRQRKFLRRMVATPMKKTHFFTALALGRMVFISIEFGTLYGFAKYFFDVQIQGSPLAFAMVMLSGTLCFFGLATLIASRTTSPQVGIGLINAATLPMFVISGMFFSYERFPAALHPWLSKFPPTMMVDALRSVMNEAAGLAAAAPASLALATMGALCLIVGGRLFRWY
jgi:ABC-2 type transport system permease protein